MTKLRLTCTFALALTITNAGCSSKDDGTPATGGAPNGGSASGGTPSSGGASGGKTASGGSTTGGATPGAGGSANGGATNAGSAGKAAGGSSATGGSASAGAAGKGTAGSTANGGSDNAGTPVALHGPLKVVGTQLTDSHDQPVQLKGPSSMWLNWESKKFAEDKQGVGWLRDNWRATLIRAAMGIDTTDTDDYLSAPDVASAAVDQIVQNAIDLGIYVLIDWHDGKADQHQAQAIEFFTKMAQKWGSYPNVLYETFNEPTTQAWATVIKPYHEAVVAAIRAVDPDNVIILGTRNYSQYVDEAALAPVAGTNLMYTLHFYSCSHKQPFRDRGDAALAANAPIFVTEWGATNADGGTTRNPALCLDEAQLWHDWMNAHKISWAAWKFDSCVDKTCYFNSPDVPTTGGWSDDVLNGHAPFVRDRMKE